MLRAQLGLTILLTLLVAAAPAALAEAALHDAGRAGAGAIVAILGEGGDDVRARLLDVAPDATLHHLPAATEDEALSALRDALALDPHVLLVDLSLPGGPLDGSSRLSRALAYAVEDGVTVVVGTGDAALRHWKGPWRDAGGDGLLDAPIAVRLAAGAPFTARLEWRTDAIGDDYDLFLYDADLKAPLAWSATYDNARESLTFTPDAPMRAHLVVRGYRVTEPADLRITVDGATLGERAVADGSLQRPADARGVVSVSANLTTSGRGPTDDGRAAPTLVGAPGATGSAEAAARAAGVLALLAVERPDLAPAALADLAAAHWPDAAAAVRAADATPARLASVVTNRTGAVGPGAVEVRVAFDDALDPNTGSLSLVTATGTRVPLSVTERTARALVATATLAPEDGDGPVDVDISGYRDWAGHAVDAARVDLDLVLDATPPVVAWRDLPALALGKVNLSWRLNDATSGVAWTRVESRAAGADAWTPVSEAAGAFASASWTPEAAGAFSFRVLARDASGNTATVEAPSRVLADLAPPRVEQGGTIGDPRDRTPNLTAVLSDDASGIDAATIRLRLNGAPVAHAYDAATGIVSHVPTADLAVGWHDLALSVRDIAGRSAALEWRVEVAPPDLALVYPLAQGGASWAAGGHASGAPAGPALPPSVGSAWLRWKEAPLTPAPQAPVAAAAADDASRGETALERTAREALTFESVEAPVPAPAYDWQPPAMVLVFALLAGAAMWIWRERVARGMWLTRVWLDQAWSRVRRARFRLMDAKGIPRRVALHLSAFAHRMRWRAAQALERARRRRSA